MAFPSKNSVHICLQTFAHVKNSQNFAQKLYFTRLEIFSTYANTLLPQDETHYHSHLPDFDANSVSAAEKNYPMPPIFHKNYCWKGNFQK